MSVVIEMRSAGFSSVFKLCSASVVSLVGLIILLVALGENREILKYAACLYAHSNSIIVHLRNSFPKKLSLCHIFGSHLH